MIVTVCEVNGIIRTNIEPVGICDGTVPPRVQIVPVAVKHKDGRVFTLKSIDAVFGVSRNGADRTEAPACGQRAPIVDHLVSILATADCTHECALLFVRVIIL
jgi:hypothetical protein